MSMSRAWYVRCDRCGNPAEINCFSAREARQYAVNQGYARYDGDDLCPGCAARSSAVHDDPKKEQR